MSNFYHDSIPFNSPANTSVINAPMGQLDQAIKDVEDAAVDGLADLKTGVDAMTQLRFDSTTTLTINASGVITISRTRHLVDTAGGAATDDLDTINGGADGDVLQISIVSNARAVRVRHLAGNIFIDSQQDIWLRSTRQILQFTYSTANSRWSLTGTVGVGIQTPTFYLDEVVGHTRLLEAPHRAVSLQSDIPSTARLLLQPDYEARNWFAHRASAGTVLSIGVAAPTIANSPSAGIADDGNWTTMPTTSSSGNAGGFISSFDLLRRTHQPEWVCVFKTPATITSMRLWIGLSSADAPDADSISSGVFFGLRFSTVAGDTNWRVYGYDGTVTVNDDSFLAVTADTRYVLRMRLDDNGEASWTINGTVISAPLINSLSTNLGVVFRVITQTAAIRQLLFGRAMAVFD